MPAEPSVRPTPPLGRLLRILLSRPAGAAAGAATALIILGCMSITLGGRTVTYENATIEGVTTFEGDAHVAGSGCQDVYYPAPFASKPNLEVTDAWGDCAVIDQHEEFFRLQNASAFGRTAHWKARGVRGTPSPPPVLAPAPPDPAPPVPALPAEPVPAAGAPAKP
jgi:hypothetical protein